MASDTLIDSKRARGLSRFDVYCRKAAKMLSVAAAETAARDRWPTQHGCSTIAPSARIATLAALAGPLATGHMHPVTAPVRYSISCHAAGLAGCCSRSPTLRSDNSEHHGRPCPRNRDVHQSPHYSTALRSGGAAAVGSQERHLAALPDAHSVTVRTVLLLGAQPCHHHHHTAVADTMTEQHFANCQRTRGHVEPDPRKMMNLQRKASIMHDLSVYIESIMRRYVV